MSEKASKFIVDFLVKNGVTHVFELCGGALTHILDSFYKRKDISVISMHHEQAAAFAAEGFSRASGKYGVAMATSGPGATNLITGIGSCFFDSVPCVFLTGQVNTYEFKFEKSTRQLGFQETDIASVVRPIVKSATMINDAKLVSSVFEKSFLLTKDGRPGPVLIDIPLDVQRTLVPSSPVVSVQNKITIVRPEKKEIAAAQEMIAKAKRPVILIGGGVRISDAVEALNVFVNKTRIPVVSSLMGLDAVDHTKDYYIGMIGTYGNRSANLTVANSDLLIVIGSRLDSRQTGTALNSFAREAKKIHVDIDGGELNCKIKADLAVKCDAKAFLEDIINGLTLPEVSPWLKVVARYKEKYFYFSEKLKGINPGNLMRIISDALPDDCVVCTDVGLNQMWAAQNIKLRKGQRFLTQGGMAAIGSALPMAIGASFAKPGKTIIVISGDGGFQLNIQELETVKYYKLPIKILLLNNHAYGMIKQFQEQYFEGRLQSSVNGYSAPNFVKVASAFGIKSQSVPSSKGLSAKIKNALKGKQPILLDIKISSSAKALPKLSVNKPIEDQEPMLPREELKENMIVKMLQD